MNDLLQAKAKLEFYEHRSNGYLMYRRLYCIADIGIADDNCISNDSCKMNTHIHGHFLQEVPVEFELVWNYKRMSFAGIDESEIARLA